MPRTLHGHYVLFKAPDEFDIPLPEPEGDDHTLVSPKATVKLASFVDKVHKAGDYLVGIFHLGGPDGTGMIAQDSIYFVGPDRHNIEVAVEVEMPMAGKMLKVFTVCINPKHVLALAAAKPEHAPVDPKRGDIAAASNV